MAEEAEVQAARAGAVGSGRHTDQETKESQAMTANTPTDPTCDKCGAPITTGFMCFFCPRREQCEFFPHDSDAETQEFVRSHWETE